MFLPFRKLFKYFLYFVSAFAALITCLVVYLIWFQPPFNFPKPTGSHAVGVKTYHWIDSKRKETLHDDPIHPNRELMVSIWYPAQGKVTEKPTTPYAPYIANYHKISDPVGWVLLGYSRPMYSYAQPKMPLISDVEKFPVILFSHGLGVSRDGNTAMCEELASHGYVVVGISHTYDCGVVQFADGRIADGVKAISQRFAKNRRFLDDDNEIEIWVSDVSFVLDQLEKLGYDKESFFYNRLDQKNIGIFGHSFGGATAVQICQRDSRVKVGVALDGILYGYDETQKNDKPFMAILAGDMVKTYERPWTKDDWNKFRLGSLDEEKKFRATYLPAFKKFAQSKNHDFYTLVLDGADHMDFCDTTLQKQSALLARFLGNFGAGYINGFRLTEIVNAYLVNFFDKYLKEQPSELLDGNCKGYEEVKIKQW